MGEEALHGAQMASAWGPLGNNGRVQQVGSLVKLVGVLVSWLVVEVC